MALSCPCRGILYIQARIHFSLQEAVNHMSSEDSPFKEGTKIYCIFTTLLDQEWHCGKHELPGTQPAKAIQIIRQHGFNVENKTTFCPVCNDRTVHRRLVSLQPVRDSFVRLQIPQELRRRVLSYYKNIEAITLRELVGSLGLPVGNVCSLASFYRVRTPSNERAS